MRARSGFVGIVGADLIGRFDACRSCRMRVGALPQNPTGLLGYAFNWSPEGVVNEYLNDCEVSEEGTRKWVSAMEWLETVYIDGVRLEASWVKHLHPLDSASLFFSADSRRFRLVRGRTTDGIPVLPPWNGLRVAEVEALE